MTLAYRHGRPPRAVPSRSRHSILTAVMALLATGSAAAAEIDIGSSDITLRWDNTVKYSAAFRVHARDSALAPDGSDPNAVVAGLNADDGDRNFARGLISNRFDLFSEADMAYHGLGARISGAAWYDSVYTQSNDNNSAGLFGPGSSTSNSSRGFDQFTAGTRKWHGEGAQLLDAFVYDKLDVGQTSTTVRLGQHALVWGESLFLGSNAIAGAQNPTNIIKASSVPNSQFKEIVLPTPQISMQSILSPTVSLGAYYQFKYVANLLPAVGSYFSVSDLGPQGTNTAYVGPATQVPINTVPVKNNGQGGLQLRLALGETDVGFYAIRFTQKNLETYPVLGLNAEHAVAPTGFEVAHQEGITAFGASFSRNLGDFNIAGEASTRRHTDLPTARAADASALMHSSPNNDSDNPAYPIGNTLHANLSTIWAVPHSSFWDDASFLGEVAWNRMLDCTKNCAVLPPNGTRDAWQIAAVMTPTYYQVVSGLNLSVPIGLNYTPKGSRSMALGAGPSGPENGGSFNVGLQGLYLDAWRVGLTYNHYFGKAAYALVGSSAGNEFSYQQSLKDRDYVSFALSRTF